MNDIKRLIKQSKLIETYHGTINLYKDNILKEGLRKSIGGFGDGVYTTVNYDDAIKYALSKAANYLWSNNYNEISNPIIIVCKIDDENSKLVYNNNYHVTPGDLKSSNIKQVINISNDKRWQKILKLLNIYKKEKTDGHQWKLDEELYFLKNLV